ncbi:MAG TPA: type II secretion system protein [Rhizomicrobium sp.]|jgi:general secretion pathway protein I|nr:type II secretion system protein [Rhizomicrobium sp.]
MTSKSQRGFTLVELLVSLAILSVALAVLFGAISSSLDRVRVGRDDALASALVQSLIARAGTERPLAPGEASGTYSNGYRWDLLVRPYGSDADAKAWRMTAYQIVATVSWRDGADSHARRLTALKFVPPKKPA